jgi:hypothetical protein
MRAASGIFGKDAFRKPKEVGRNPISKALFDAWSVNLADLDDRQIRCLIGRKNLLLEKFMNLLSFDSDFEKSISVSTANSRKIKIRFSSIEKIIVKTLTGGILI